MNNYMIQFLFKIIPVVFTTTTISIGTVFWCYNNAANKNIDASDKIINNDI